MTTNTNDIRRGMEVFAVDGEQMGKVVEVVPPTAGEEVGPGGEGRAGDIAGQPDAPGRGGLGPVPSGVTQDKGRGSPTAAGAATEAGDVHTTLGQEGATPGAGGLDAMRGYGMPRNLTQNPPGRPMTAGELEDLRGGGGSAGGDTILDDMAPLARPGYILVQDDGALGVDARRLHLPFDTVLDVVPGRRITINCTRDDAAMRYGGGPSLDIDENEKFTPF